MDRAKYRAMKTKLIFSKGHRNQLGGDIQRHGAGSILLQLLPEHEAAQSDNKGGEKARLQGLRSPEDKDQV